MDLVDGLWNRLMVMMWGFVLGVWLSSVVWSKGTIGDCGVGEYCEAIGVDGVVRLLMVYHG